MADLNLFENVYQTTTDGGTGSLNLIAAPAGRLGIEDWASNGDKVVCTIKGGVQVETSLCTFNTGPNRITRDTVLRSTESPPTNKVNWAGGGTLDVTIGLPGTWLEKLFNNDLANGMLARLDGKGDIVARTLQGGSYITWNNPDGIAGDPAIVETGLSANFARKNLAQTITGAQTFSDPVTLSALLTLAANRARLSALTGTADFIFRGNVADDSDMALRIARQAADDYLAFVRIGGAWKRIHYDGDAAIDAATVESHSFSADRTLAAKGHYILPGNLLLNWAEIANVSSSGSADTFDKAFSAVYGAVAQYSEDPGGDGEDHFLFTKTLTTTTITLQTGADANLTDAFYIAIGLA